VGGAVLVLQRVDDAAPSPFRVRDWGTWIACAGLILWSFLWNAGPVQRMQSPGDFPWWLFLPYQLVLVSPGLVPIWVAGLVVLLRSAALRPYRLIAVAYLVLVVVFLFTGGSRTTSPGSTRPCWPPGRCRRCAGCGRGAGDGDSGCWGWLSWCRYPISSSCCRCCLSLCWARWSP
jgi:hypothetical protein